MAVALTILHVLICLLLIGIVLMQGGRGAEMGAAFGGSSQTLFGSRGAATFLGKLTTVFAILFMITSLALTLVSIRGGSIIKSSGRMPSPGPMPAQHAPLAPQPPVKNIPPAGK